MHPPRRVNIRSAEGELKENGMERQSVRDNGTAGQSESFRRDLAVPPWRDREPGSLCPPRCSVCLRGSLIAH